MLRLLLGAALLGVLALPVGASGSPIVPQLTATVTAKSITLVGADGKRVRVLQPNMYVLIVHDRTVKQNFHLLGSRVSVKTGIAARTTKKWSVYLKPGSYSYRSDRNTALHGAFIVAGSPPA
jgi:hypothetical protein